VPGRRRPQRRVLRIAVVGVGSRPHRVCVELASPSACSPHSSSWVGGAGTWRRLLGASDNGVAAVLDSGSQGTLLVALTPGAERSLPSVYDTNLARISAAIDRRETEHRQVVEASCERRGDPYLNTDLPSLVGVVTSPSESSNRNRAASTDRREVRQMTPRQGSRSAPGGRRAHRVARHPRLDTIRTRLLPQTSA